MSEPHEFGARQLQHISIDRWREPVGYTYPARAQERRPLRDDYAAHAQSLLTELAAALPPLPAEAADNRARIPGLNVGSVVEVETRAPDGPRAAATKMPLVEFPAEGIVLLRSSRSDERTEAALMFVPDRSRQFLRDRIAAYGRRPLGNAPRPDIDRFERIEHVSTADARALFPSTTDFGTAACWWEFWIRQAPGRADSIGEIARNMGLQVHGEHLIFPDTVILLVHGLPVQALQLAEKTLGAVSEVCKATGTIRPFLERGDKGVGQAEFVDELLERVDGPPADAPLVSVLDTGVAAAHPLVAKGLAGAHAYDERWGTDDHEPNGGHGTGVLGLVLYGDLETPMSDKSIVELRHGAISMKLLPPAGFKPTDPIHYGTITQGAVANIEIAHGQASRTFCLACSTAEFTPARPSTWSGALDQIAAGSGVGDVLAPDQPALRRPKRLVVVATGNIRGGMRDQVEAQQSIEDPSQSWNALTIGGYTTKENVAKEDQPLQPLVAANNLSPFSRCSDLLPFDLTPIKPEVVFEAGNMLVDKAGYCDWNPSVSLLSLGSDPNTAPLIPMWATSAAAGIAGNFLGRLEAELPGLWPETYRALTVQSAEWPTPVRDLLIGPRGAHWRSGKRVNATIRQGVVRRAGFGVPNITRAVRSARNAVTLTAQADIQPFATGANGTAVYNEMHFYDLPWPRAALQQLENEVVTMKVTLSYFIEPNLTGRAATRPDTYRSHGLRFSMKRRGETGAQFRARVNAAQSREDGPADPEASYWLLGPKAISAGSLHCDVWRGHAVDLALHDAIAIFPVGGWWKSHTGQRRMNDRARYSLAISISAEGQNVDLHGEITGQIEARAGEVKLEP